VPGISLDSLAAVEVQRLLERVAQLPDERGTADGKVDATTARCGQRDPDPDRSEHRMALEGGGPSMLSPRKRRSGSQCPGPFRGRRGPNAWSIFRRRYPAYTSTILGSPSKSSPQTWVKRSRLLTASPAKRIRPLEKGELSWVSAMVTSPRRHRCSAGSRVRSPAAQHGWSLPAPTAKEGPDPGNNTTKENGFDKKSSAPVSRASASSNSRLWP